MSEHPLAALPAHLLPADGRFGAGPSKVRPEQLDALIEHRHLLGTSHRQAPVKNLVADVQAGLRDLFALPEGYEVVTGLGGATAFWDAATFSLVRSRAQHLSFGEFGAKFASATSKAPFLQDSVVITAAPGTRSAAVAQEGIDVYAYPHNETSTGVFTPVARVAGADPDALVVVDGTSAAGGLSVDPAQADVYYFSLQKNFASDGGLWFAFFSPAARARVEQLSSGDRWIPDFLNLGTALSNSASHQTYNTPALPTLIMLREQLNWLNVNGGLKFATDRTADSAQRLYSWAEASDFATPFVANADERSNVIATIDFSDDVDAAALASTLRANGIVDVEPYRKLGRNQLRLATFVAIDPEDVSALTRCIDYLVENR